MMKRLAILWLILNLILEVNAQDFHLSTFYHSPLTISPSEAGNFDGSYRISGFRRNQWQAVTQPYQTFAIAADANEAFGLKPFGIGLQLINDVAGDGKFKEFYLQMPLAYHLKFGYKSAHQLSVGLMPGMLQSSINFALLNFDSQYQNGQFDPKNPNGEALMSDNLWQFTFSAGGSYQFLGKRHNRFNLSLAYFNLIEPPQEFVMARNPLSKRFSAIVSANKSLNSKLEISPSAMYALQNDNQLLVIGSNIRYVLKPKAHDYFSVITGIHWRNQDAFIPSMGFEMNKLSFRISYDLLYSELQTTAAGRGGAEFSVIYLFDKRPPKRMNFQQCPTFM